MNSIQNKNRQIIHNFNKPTQNMRQAKDDFFGKLKRFFGTNFKSEMAVLVAAFQRSYNAWAGGEAAPQLA